jgi:hypothetical protein
MTHNLRHSLTNRAARPTITPGLRLVFFEGDTMKEHRPTVRSLVKLAQQTQPDHNGEPVYTVAGYCGNSNCEIRWHEELVSTLAQFDPVPTSLRCPDCGRRLSHRGHAPYQLREHWPVTGEDSGCRFHENTRRTDVMRPLRRARSFAEFANTRFKKKLLGGSRHRGGKRLTIRGAA